MAFLIPATDTSEKPPKYLCSTFDQAIDKQRSDLAAYRKTLDVRELKPLARDRLTKFEFSPCDEDTTTDIECSYKSPKHLGVLYYRACVSSYYDVQIKDGDEVLHGRSSDHKLIPWDVRAEIGLYARRFCSEVAPDFYGLSLRTPADDTKPSPDGVETAQDADQIAAPSGQSQTETTSGGKQTST